MRMLIDALRAYHDALAWENQTRRQIEGYMGARDWDNPEYVDLHDAVMSATLDTYRADEDCTALGIESDEDYMILWMK